VPFFCYRLVPLILVLRIFLLHSFFVFSLFDLWEKLQLFKQHHSLGIFRHAPVNYQLLPKVLQVLVLIPDCLSYERFTIFLIDDVFCLLLSLACLVLEILLLTLYFIPFWKFSLFTDWVEHAVVVDAVFQEVVVTKALELTWFWKPFGERLDTLVFEWLHVSLDVKVVAENDVLVFKFLALFLFLLAIFFFVLVTNAVLYRQQ